MSVIFILIPLSIIIAGCFLVGFIWAVRSGQYEDTCTPSMRVLLDDVPSSNKKGPSSSALGQQRGYDDFESNTERHPQIVSTEKPRTRFPVA